MKKLIIAAMISTIGLNVQAARVEMLDNMMFTINPEARTEGPIFQNTAAVKSVYGNEIITMLLKNADQLAKKYLSYDDPEAYYAFMSLALTVPMHEGLFMHFREVDNERGVCRKNPDKIVKEAGRKTLKIFKEYLMDGRVPYLPKCRKISKRVPRVKQIVRGANGTDIGMMQVSVRWHYDVFLANKNYESVNETIQYGLKFLMKGFDPLYRKAADYDCITIDDKVNYSNLVRGIWGGFYNGGSYKKACRFADLTSPYQPHDNGFKKNLDKVLAYPETGIIGMHEDLYLQLSGDVKAAVIETIKNMRNKTDNRNALKKLLNK